MQKIETADSRLNVFASLNRIQRWLLVVLVSLTPAIVTLLLFGFLRADLRQFLPLNWNDQTWMWHQVLTFREAGFDGGYYVVNEMPAPADFSHFSSWGPVFPAMVGTFARLTGWEPYTGILLNIALLTVTVGVFLSVIPFDRSQIMLTGLVLLLLTPILMYIPTISQESFHQSAAFVVAGIFYALLSKRPLPRWLRWTFVVFLIFLVVLRFSWVIFFVPLFFLDTPQPGRRGVFIALLKATLIALPICLLIGYISAPGGNFLFTILSALTTAPLKAIGNLLLLMVENIYRFLFPLDDQGMVMADFVQALQFVMLLVMLVIVWRQQRHALRRSSAGQSGVDLRFHLYNLGMIFILALLFYRWYGYYRIFGVHLLVTLLILIGFKQYRLVGTFLVVGMLGLPVFVNHYERQHGNLFPQDRAALQLETIHSTFKQHLVYEPEALNPWCNTLLVPTRLLDYHVLAVPAKIGISFIWFGDLEFPLKSRYLLFDETAYQEMKDRLRVEPLASLPEATLYRNLDSKCPDS